ncbi:hypothetical protein D3C71_426830 [compost metagenome]
MTDRDRNVDAFTQWMHKAQGEYSRQIRHSLAWCSRHPFAFKTSQRLALQTAASIFTRWWSALIERIPNQSRQSMSRNCVSHERLFDPDCPLTVISMSESRWPHAS